MNNNTIKTMSKATVDYIANKLGCTATKAELVKQFKAQPEALETAYAEAKAKAKAEAEPRKQQKAEAEAKKQEAIAKAEAEAKKQKTTGQKQKQKQTKQQKQKDSKAEAKQSNKAEVIALAKELGLTVRETEADNKKSRVFLVDKKAVAQVVYSKTGKGFQIKSNTEFKDAEYHEGWANKYAKRYTTIAQVKTVIKEIMKTKAEAKKTATK